MPTKPGGRYPTEEERDEPVAIPLDPEEALRALLAADPDDKPRDDQESNDALGELRREE